MRVHMQMDDDLVAAVDRVAGPRGRTAFIVEAVDHALRRAERLAAFDRAVGSIADVGHEWDADPAGWVAAQRRQDARRIG